MLAIVLIHTGSQIGQQRHHYVPPQTHQCDSSVTMLPPDPLSITFLEGEAEASFWAAYACSVGADSLFFQRVNVSEVLAGLCKPRGHTCKINWARNQEM